MHNKYKTSRNCLTKLKHNAKVNYYVNKCYSLKSNVKKLWQFINSIIKRTNDETTLIDHITVNNIEYYESQEISNHFGKFYSKLGENVVNPIAKPKLTPHHYLNKIQINLKMLYLYYIYTIFYITPNEIKKYIDKLPAKNSS